MYCVRKDMAEEELERVAQAQNDFANPCNGRQGLGTGDRGLGKPRREWSGGQQQSTARTESRPSRILGVCWARSETSAQHQRWRPPEGEESRGRESEAKRNRKRAYQKWRTMSQHQPQQRFAPRRVIPCLARLRPGGACKTWNHL